MQEQILDIFTSDPKHAVGKIKKDVALWNWILEKCDPACLDDKTRIYTAYHGQPISCPCGSGKLQTYVSFFKNLSFCGRANSCSAAREAVSSACKKSMSRIDKVAANRKREETNKEKYGVSNVGQSEKALATRRKIYETPESISAITEQTRQTTMDRYGVSHVSLVPEIKERTRATMLERYGHEHAAQNEEIKEKTRRTNMKRYGVEYPINTPEVKEKTTATNLEKYGVKWALGAEIIRQKINTTNLSRYGCESILGNAAQRLINSGIIMNKYGVPVASQSEEVKNRTRKSNLSRYGVPFSSQRDYSELAKSVLFDKALFSSHLSTTSVPALATLLGVSETTILNFHHMYQLDIIKCNSSSYENELSEWLNGLGITHVRGNRTICSPQEIDIYIPTYNLAIEFDGLYWHSENMGKDKNYHLNKTKKCLDSNITLLHIFEDEWLSNKEVCKSIIKSYCHGITTKIPARKCVIKELSNKDCRDFLNNNHLQGKVNASLSIGLFFNDDLVSLLTFGKPRYNKNIQWELLRLATKIDIVVQGGSAKLWNYFIETYKPISVVSYCDRRWFLGNIYQSLSFEKKAEAKPTYWYTNFNKRFHRSHFTKSKCIAQAKLLSVDEDNMDWSILSERQIAKEILGLDRIWDCGQDTWVWKKPID